MARKGGIVSTISKSLRREQSVVATIYRFLNEARVITYTGARGRNAPGLPIDDEAAILVAMLGTRKPSEGPQAVKDFGTLPNWRIDQRMMPNGEPGPDDPIRLPAHKHTFMDGVVAVLKHLNTLPLEEALFLPVRIKLSPSELRAEIEVSGWRYVYNTDEFWSWYVGASEADLTPHQLEEASLQTALQARWVDELEESRAISNPKIAEIASIFREG